MNVKKAIVLADSQGKYFHQHLEHEILTMFNSGDRVNDLYKHMDILPACYFIEVEI